MGFGAAATKSNSPLASGHYVWTVPGKRISIRLLVEIVDRLAAEVMDAFWAVPKRGAEIGGLLLGRKPLDGTIIIEGYDLVPCEHQRGPSYRLSDHDHAEFGRAIERRSCDPERQVIGYFRSHTRDGFELEEEDASLIRRYFADPSDIALLVKPFANSSCVAGFFTWEDGAIRLESSCLQFPFSRRDLANTEQFVPEIIPQAHSVQEPVSPVAGQASTVETELPQLIAEMDMLKRLRTGIKRWLPVTAVILSSLLLLTYGIRRVLSSSNPVAGVYEKPSVQLYVAHSGQYLYVTWNRNAPAIAEAHSGLLRITDGSYMKELHLDQTDLRSGSVAYMPRTPDVDVKFRFDLEGNHRTVTESLRVVIPPHPELVQSGQESHSADASTASNSQQIRADTTAAPAAKRRSKGRRRLH